MAHTVEEYERNMATMPTREQQNAIDVRELNSVDRELEEIGNDLELPEEVRKRLHVLTANVSIVRSHLEKSWQERYSQ